MNISSSREIQTEILDLLEEPIRREGFELVAVQLIRLGGRLTLRLSIDRTGGVTLDECARVSRLTAPLLDASDPVQGAYDLEVSSPGLERPVQKIGDFARFTGRQVRIRMAAGHARKRFTGSIVSVDASAVTLQGADGLLHALPFTEIEKANLLPEREGERLNEGPAPEVSSKENPDDQ
jgi:ribosome maturation factor RimP